MSNFQEYMILSEWMGEVVEEVNGGGRYSSAALTDKHIIHILKRYEELKKEVGRVAY